MNNLVNCCIENNCINLYDFVDEEMLKCLKNKIDEHKIKIDCVVIPSTYKFINSVKTFFPEMKYILV